ncbi:RNA polymerase sigma-70 factor [Sphingobacterium suaedae]|uniref:RNA polymerase sigma-70 factor n=1 Tax=Sphingobacterium suaedae TaxID=1686402 RepID=A0ABW5KFX7_9SPHI
MIHTKEKKFEAVFREHFKELHGYAYRMIGNSDAAEEIVQHVFLKLWERDWEKTLQSSWKAYLYRSVHNQTLNTLKRYKLQQRYEAYQTVHAENLQDLPFGEQELKKELHAALAKLPEKSRIVFEMSRFQELRYKEIADTLNLSVKTVEGHMTKALRHLRVHLIDYLTVLVLLFTYKL